MSHENDNDKDQSINLRVTLRIINDSPPQDDFQSFVVAKLTKILTDLGIIIHKEEQIMAALPEISKQVINEIKTMTIDLKSAIANAVQDITELIEQGGSGGAGIDPAEVQAALVDIRDGLSTAVTDAVAMAAKWPIGSPPPPANAPVAPGNVSAVSGNGEATISFDSVSNATSYNVYSGTSTGVTKINGSPQVGVTSPSIASGLSNGVSYYFVVTAVNTDGESVESSEVTATPA